MHQRGRGSRRLGRGCIHVVPLLLLLTGTGPSPCAWAGTPDPYGVRQFADPEGKFYVVVAPTPDGEILGARQPGPRAEFVLAERSPKQPAVTSCVLRGELTKGTPRPHRGSRVLLRGTLPELPVDVLVSPTGEGFLAIDAWGAPGRRTVLVAVSSTSGILREATLTELFESDELSGFLTTDAGVSWYAGGWPHEDGGAGVVVGFGGTPLLVDLRTGRASRNVPIAVLLEALAPGDARRVFLAGEILLSRESGRALDRLTRIVADEGRSPSERTAAALVVEHGRPHSTVGDALWRRLLDPRHQVAPDVRRKVIEEAGVVLGRQAVACLLPYLQSAESAYFYHAQAALETVGPQAGPELTALIDDQSVSRDCKEAALWGIQTARIEAASAQVVALAERAMRTDPALARAAVATALTLDPSLSERFLGDEVDPGVIRHVAYHLTTHGRMTAVPELIRTLERTAVSDDLRLTLADALEFQTGERYGGNAAAWRAWLTRRGDR